MSAFYRCTTGQRSDQIKQLFITNGGRKQLLTLQKNSLNGEKYTCLGFSIPNFPGFFPFFPDFFPIQAILQLLGRKKPKFLALRANLGLNHPKFAPARAKNWGRKQVSLTAGVGKKQGLWPEY